jgi:hypothetical protein
LTKWNSEFRRRMNVGIKSGRLQRKPVDNEVSWLVLL